MKTYRVGVASLVHDHIWGELENWKRLPNAQVVAAGDVSADLRLRVRNESGVANVYESWRAMLDAEGDRLDIVQVAAENSAHADIVEACAARGLPVIVEKPMAAARAQAQRMATAAANAQTFLYINWPIAWHPSFQELDRRILGGEIGQVRYFKFRSAHNGPREIGCDPHFVEWLYDAEKNGAGALMDYCGYGAVLCARYLGTPERVTGLRGVLAKEYPLPDDNAIIVMQYPHAFGVAEASWTQVTGYAANNPVVYGSTGALSLAEDGTVVLQRENGATERITPPASVAPYRSGPEYVLHCLETGAVPEGIGAPATSLIAQTILEAGLRAADTGQTQVL